MDYHPSACCATPFAQGSEIVVARLDADRDAVCRESALLSGAERQRASRFVRERDRERFILGRATLRRLLGARLRIPASAVEVVIGPHGKPALGPRLRRSGLRFNLSHCADVAAFGFAWGREIGVDVEAVRAIPDADSIAQQFFSRREIEAYFALSAVHRPLGFFNCWTRKEAFVKAVGDGLGFGLHRFDVSLDPGAPARLLRVDGDAGEQCGWVLRDFVPTPGFVGAVVTQSAMVH